MKTIIAGSRSFGNDFYPILYNIVHSCYWIPSLIISGGARGIDSLAIKYASNKHIPYVIMNADWEKYGKSAGYRRNVEMANSAQALIAIWDGKSKGTKHMIDIAKTKELVIHLHEVVL